MVNNNKKDNDANNDNENGIYNRGHIWQWVGLRENL